MPVGNTGTCQLSISSSRQVGLPAKSGVSGALVLVVPNVMGVGIWSPPLDALGNTVRGVQFSKVRGRCPDPTTSNVASAVTPANPPPLPSPPLQELVRTFRLHRFDNLVGGRGWGNNDGGRDKIDPRTFKQEHRRQSILCVLYAATTGDLTALKRSVWQLCLVLPCPSTVQYLQCVQRGMPWDRDARLGLHIYIYIYLKICRFEVQVMSSR